MKRFLKQISAILMTLLLVAGCVQLQPSTSSTVSSISSSPVNVEMVALTVERLPYKLEYTNFEGINTAGGQLKVNLSNSQSFVVDMRDDMVDYSLLNMANIGTQSVRLNYTYQGVSRSVTYSITVRDFKIAVNSIFFVNLELTINLFVGLTRPLLVSFVPSDATNQGIKFESSAPEIVSIDQFGIMQALKVGEATVTATSLETNQAISKTVVVAELVDQLTVTLARELINRLNNLVAGLNPSNYTAANFQLILDAFNNGVNGISQAVTISEANAILNETLAKIANISTIPTTTPIVVVNYAQIQFDSINLDIIVNSGGVLNPSHPLLSEVATIDGTITLRNLTISAEVEDGTLTIEDFIITGSLTVLGGGSNSVILNRVDIIKVIINKDPATGNEVVRVEFGDGQFEEIIVQSDVIIETFVNIPNLVIDAGVTSAITLVTRDNAALDNLTVLSPATIELTNSNVSFISVQANTTITGLSNSVVANQSGSLTINNAPVTEQGIINIDDNGSAGAAVTGFYILNKYANYATFGDLLAGLNDNDYVLVSEGTYDIGSVIIDKNNVILIAAGRKDSTTLEIDELGITGNNFMISGLTIDGKNGTVTGGKRTIAPRTSSGTKIVNNQFINSERHIQGDYFGSLNNILIQGNTFNDGPNAIAGTENGTNVQIIGNTFNGLNRIGIGAGISGLIITGNNFVTQSENVRVITDYRTVVGSGEMTLQQIVDQNTFTSFPFIEPYGSNFMILNNNKLIAAARLAVQTGAGATVLRDTTLTTTNGEATFSLNYRVQNYDDNGTPRLQIIGDAETDLKAQQPGAGGWWGIGYLGLIFERPNAEVDSYKIKIVYSYAPTYVSPDVNTKYNLIGVYTAENYFFAGARETSYPTVAVWGGSPAPVNRSNIWVFQQSWANYTYYVTIQWFKGEVLDSIEKAKIGSIVNNVLVE
jgi:hypothetical protein